MDRRTPTSGFGAPKASSGVPALLELEDQAARQRLARSSEAAAAAAVTLDSKIARFLHGIYSLSGIDGHETLFPQPPVPDEVLKTLVDALNARKQAKREGNEENVGGRISTSTVEGYFKKLREKGSLTLNGSKGFAPLFLKLWSGLPYIQTSSASKKGIRSELQKLGTELSRDECIRLDKDRRKKDINGNMVVSYTDAQAKPAGMYWKNSCDVVLTITEPENEGKEEARGGRRKSRKLGNTFNRCVKSVRKTVKARKGSSKESAAIAICTKSVLHTRGKTMKRYRKGRLITQKKFRGGNWGTCS